MDGWMDECVCVVVERSDIYAWNEEIWARAGTAKGACLIRHKNLLRCITTTTALRLRPSRFYRDAASKVTAAHCSTHESPRRRRPAGVCQCSAFVKLNSISQSIRQSVSHFVSPPVDPRLSVCLISGPCIRGHRSTSCNHKDRLLLEVRKPGRPLSSCPHLGGNCSCERLVINYTIPRYLLVAGTPPRLKRPSKQPKTNPNHAAPKSRLRPPVLHLMNTILQHPRTKTRPTLSPSPARRLRDR
ncbi:hypothetical protein JOL62DRAFT_337121 [Phyllosticta paracitricarpa]|uniref:Copper-fist domain-containing protein n=1 Tax=Phyllosticta paracitricarpa TaxID=2016321 RepID=A0ABR1MXA9_9PEZI